MQKPELDPNDPHVHKALVVLTRAVWCWETLCWAFFGTAHGIATAWSGCFAFAAWTIKGSAASVVLLTLLFILAGVAYAYVNTPKEDPYLLEFETEDILVCQDEYAYTEENGVRQRIATKISMRHANPDIVKKFFVDYGYTVVEDGYMQQYDQKNGCHRERYRSINGRSHDFLVLGKAPAFKELSIHGEKVRVVLDPDYVRELKDDHWRWSVKSTMERLADQIRHNDPR